MAGDDERMERAGEPPLVGDLPDAPGIVAALRLTPGLGRHLRGLADELLVLEYPGATLTRADRELLATAVSAGNDCFYCMDSHGAFASELLKRTGGDPGVVDALKLGRSEGLSPRMQALVVVAQQVQSRPRDLTPAQVDAARNAGATESDLQLAVLIASAFCMFNRMVEGLRTPTPASVAAYGERAQQVAEHGYGDPRVTAPPR